MGGWSPYVVGVQLAVAGEAVQQSLDVGPEDGVQRRLVGLVEMLAQPVPEVEGDLHHLPDNGRHVNTFLCGATVLLVMVTVANDEDLFESFSWKDSGSKANYL